MEPVKKSNKKWIIFGIIIAVLAVIIAIGPVLLTRYMRSKTPKPTTADLMIKVSGIIKENVNQFGFIEPYLLGDNGLYYLLIGDMHYELTQNIDAKATVFGNIVYAGPNEKIGDNPMRMKINVINFGMPTLEAGRSISMAEIEKMKDKAAKRIKAREEVSKHINIGDNDFIRGKVIKEERDSSYAYIITDELEDKYLLTGVSDSILNMNVVLLGKVIPSSGYPVNSDEVVFSVSAAYNDSFDKIKKK